MKCHPRQALTRWNRHLGLVVSLYSVIGGSWTARADYTATPVPTTTWATWDAWGTSLAWMGKAFGNRLDVAEVLFGTNETSLNGTSLPGLGFNFARYNTGACGAETVNGQGMVYYGLIPETEIQGYWLNPGSTDPSSSSWDWSLDANQRTMLLNAKALGANRFELFANSPMWWMCIDHCPGGNGGNVAIDNLASANYDEYAIELATIAQYAQAHWGIDFTTVEAFNEPVSSWWGTNGTSLQEACHFANGSQPPVINDLRSELNSRGLNSVVISAPDDFEFDQTISTWNSYSATTQSQVGQINSHGYQGYGTGGNQSGLYSLAAGAGKALYDTEYGDNDTSGLTMAGAINYQINTLHPNGWTYWQPLDGDGKDANWGMIKASFSAGTIGTIEPKYYVMAQYSRHIRQGMTILDSGDANSVAAYDPVAHKLVIVTANRSSAQKITYNLANYTTVSGPVTRWNTVTGSGDKYVEYSDLSLSGKTFSSQFAANSVQTFEIQNVVLGGGTGGGGSLANGTYKIINRNSGLALDVFGAATTNGSAIDQYPYQSHGNQQWTLTSNGSGQYTITGVQSGKVLDVTGASTANGALIELYTNHGGSNQEWVITPTTGGYYTIQGVQSGKLMEVIGGGTGSGVLVDQWTSNGGNNQQWSFGAP